MAAPGSGQPIVDVLVIGDVVTDVLVRPLGPRQAGSDTPSRIEEQHGGQGANQATWLAAEGVAVGLAGRVGRSEQEGAEHALRSAGVVPFLVADAARPSGRIVVLIDPASGERDMFSDRGAGYALAPGDLAAGLTAARRWVHVSGYAVFGEHGPGVMAAVVAAARGRGLGVSVDPASSAELAAFGVDRFRALVRGVDVLLPNRDEALLLSGARTAEAAARSLLDLAEVVAVTEGADGAVLAARDGPRAHRLAAAPGPVLDTTGAGDAFSAGFLAGLVAGADGGVCLARGMRAAARAVAAFGAQPPPERS